MWNEPEDSFQPGDALIIVDVQNDFCPGGALPIENGSEVVPVLNRWIAAAVVKHIPVYASRDWHPVDHISFAQQGGPWPPHCIQDSAGARFHPRAPVARLRRKGYQGCALRPGSELGFRPDGSGQ